jgi:carbonic anhydrase/acetyltransferase-like protein (isoleucine patch superfamily)
MPEDMELCIDKIPRIAESAFISKNACVVGDVEIGENCLVMPGAVIRADFGSIRIGANVWIEDNTVIHGAPPCLDIGDGVIIGHGAVVNGRMVGNNVLIGINASILHEVEIGNRCIIAAGAVVTQGMKIPEGSFVAGVPARVPGEASKKLIEIWLERDPKRFIRLIEEYRKQGL